MSFSIDALKTCARKSQAKKCDEAPPSTPRQNFEEQQKLWAEMLEQEKKKICGDLNMDKEPGCETLADYLNRTKDEVTDKYVVKWLAFKRQDGTIEEADPFIIVDALIKKRLDNTASMGFPPEKLVMVDAPHPHFWNHKQLALIRYAQEQNEFMKVIAESKNNLQK